MIDIYKEPATAAECDQILAACKSLGMQYVDQMATLPVNSKLYKQVKAEHLAVVDRSIEIALLKYDLQNK